MDLTRTGMLVLMVLFLTVDLGIGQNTTNLFLIKGVEYGNKGQYDKAISEFTKAIEINPRFAMAYSNRGLTYGAKRNIKKACSDWKRTRELGDCRNWGLINKIRCLGK
jgi:tetratricopeptide (TPR) repeat protein